MKLLYGKRIRKGKAASKEFYCRPEKNKTKENEEKVEWKEKKRKISTWVSVRFGIWVFVTTAPFSREGRKLWRFYRRNNNPGLVPTFGGATPKDKGCRAEDFHVDALIIKKGSFILDLRWRFDWFRTEMERNFQFKDMVNSQ